ncbi:MAG: polysaccharide deacetylase family protein [Patescibacteria group bacterium]
MKKSNLRAWQVLFLFAAVLTYFVLPSGRNQNKNYEKNQSMPSPALACTSSICKASLFSARQTNTLKTVVKNKEKIASSALANQKPEQAAGYCLSVPVLLYHHIQPQSEAIRKGQASLSVDNGFFDRQMQYLLENGYNTINAPTLINALLSRTPLPPKSILVTIDDGYKDAFEYAFPILQKYRITANFMIATGLTGGEDNMSWDQISQIKQSGLAYFVNHTWSHYAVSNGSADKIQYEIQTGKKQLEEHTGQSVNIFAYPYGSFNNNAIEILKNNGFIGAFSTIPGFLQCDSFIMTLHRTHIGNASLSSYGL